MLAEARHLRAAGPDFLLVHRFRTPGIDYCEPGEEVFAVLLVQRGRKYQLPLAASQRLIFDYLAHSNIAQSSKQIEIGIRSDAFYQQHGMNAKSGKALVRQIPRSAVREHIKRLHRALVLVFQDANLPIDPRKVLVVTETVSNEVGYLLRATCRWTHLDLTAHDSQRFWK